MLQSKNTSRCAFACTPELLPPSPSTLPPGTASFCHLDSPGSHLNWPQPLEMILRACPPPKGPGFHLQWGPFPALAETFSTPADGCQGPEVPSNQIKPFRFDSVLPRFQISSSLQHFLSYVPAGNQNNSSALLCSLVSPGQRSTSYFQ